MNPQLPLECLELVVKYASTDHRVLATLMQCNTTLFRIATPYLYYEPYSFTEGDEFRLDWNTDSWTRHLRRVRHAHLLLLYLRCTEDFRNSPRLTSPAAKSTVKEEPASETLPSIARPPSPGRLPWRRPLTKSTSTPSLRQQYASSPTPPLLKTLLDSRSVNSSNTNSNAQAHTSSSTSLFKTRHINYLEYVLHVDLDTFLSSCLSIMFSSASAHTQLMHPRRRRLFFQHPHIALCRSPLAERHFIEKELLQATTHHLTTLSISITSFMHLQELLNDTLRPMQKDDLSRCEVSSTKYINSAGNRTGAPLSQLVRLCLGGLDADLSIRIMSVVRQFFRFHALAYPGRLTEVEFEGLGDISSLRRRTIRRDVQAHQQQQALEDPFQPFVVPQNVGPIEDEFHDDEDELQNLTDIQDAIEFDLGQQQQQQQQIHPAALAHNWVPFQLMNQPQIITERSPAKLVHYLRAFGELKDQLEVLDLSKWGWSTFSEQELQCIPFKHLKVLKFHPRTKAKHTQGPKWMSRFSKLKELNMNIWDPHMLDWTILDNWEVLGGSEMEEDRTPTVDVLDRQKKPALKPRPPSLRHLTLSGTVPHVLDVLQDAVTHMDKLTTIDLSASLDGFLDSHQTLQLQCWALSLPILDHLTVLRLTGHLALTFQAPLLLETCNRLRELSLSILAYTSSSLFAREADHCVVPKFLREEGDEDICLARLKVLSLEGAWVVRPRDMALMARKLPWLIELSLMGCRFFSAGPQDPSSSAHVSLPGLVRALAPMLRKIKIHRRGIEGPLDESVRLDGYRKDDRARKQGAHSRTATGTSTKTTTDTITKQEPAPDKVMAFKRRFPDVQVMIVERQNENSFVIPIQGPLLAALNGTMTWANYLRASSSMPDLHSNNNDPPGAGNGLPHPHGAIDANRHRNARMHRRFFSTRRFPPGHFLRGPQWEWKLAVRRCWWRVAGGEPPESSIPPHPPVVFRPQFPVPHVPTAAGGEPNKVGGESASTLVISRTFESLSPKGSFWLEENSGGKRGSRGFWRRDAKK
ncbi:hypothetical protein BGZ59_009549 [Podila verticillata]|nr:hypothetical protein BGZ59_009549 [Podila verticillata]